MKIKRLVIENFKSIERIELIEPNPFTVFVGPNGSGKSNIFEALEFVNLQSKSNTNFVMRLFGGRNSIVNRKTPKGYFQFDVEFDSTLPNESSVYISFSEGEGASARRLSNVPSEINTGKTLEQGSWEQHTQFYNRFARLFIGNRKKVELDFQDEQALNTTASNLEPVLKRILTESTLRAEIFEWLDLFVPGFKAVEVDDRNELHWFEGSTPDYFTKDLISDGTKNILALLTAVYQSEKPQFLCIEEPENGLHPQIIMSLVDFFRQQCAEKGHYIWLNTHSESLVRKLRSEEIILVDKREGATQTKQVGNRNFYDLQMDEAWLTGALGGGLPW